MLLSKKSWDKYAWVGQEDFGAVTAGIEDYDNLPGECGKAYERVLDRCDELLQRAHSVLSKLLDRGTNLSTEEIDAAIDAHADYSADDEVDDLITQLLERRDQLEVAAQVEAARIADAKAAEAAKEREQAAATAAEEQKRLQEKEKAAAAVDEEKKLTNAMRAESAMAQALDTETSRAAQEEVEMQLLEQMEDLAQEAIEAYLEGVDDSHPFKAMAQEPRFIKQLVRRL